MVSTVATIGNTAGAYPEFKRSTSKISRKFLTLMASQLMMPYRETNIAKKKNKLEFYSNRWC